MKNKKTYIIHLRGCDDDTYFEMELNDDELKLVQEMCKKSQEASDYHCMPDMNVREGKLNV